VLVDAGDDRSALADRAADALDRAGAHVADREDAGDARFERCALTGRAGLRAGASGDDEAGLVELDVAGARGTSSPVRRR
jgi:hypothetical protein